MRPGLVINGLVWAFIAALCVSTASEAFAKDTIKVKVEVIQASRNDTKVDPGLEFLVKEVSPVLNYTGFTLLKKVEASLSSNDSEKINMPGDRILSVQFMDFSEAKARVTVKIMENHKESFKTVLLLVDNGSALIGGPPNKDGVLLLRIGAQY